MEMCRVRSLSLLGLFVSALLSSSCVGAAESAEKGELERTLETSALSSEGRALLRERGIEATRAGVAEGDVAAILERGLKRAVPEGEIARLLDIVIEAKRQDLPIGPVLDKVKEGLAKGAPPERIVAVITRVSGDLATSRDLIRRAEREGVRVEEHGERERAIHAVADAVGRGVSRQDLEGFVRHVATSPRREATMSRLEAAAAATADLVAMGLPPRDASETVGVALSRGLDRREVARLHESLARERRRGGSLEEGARRLRDEILSGRGEPRRGREREGDRGGDRDRGGSGGREGGDGGRSGPH